MRYSGDARITLTYRSRFLLPGGVVAGVVKDGTVSFTAEYRTGQRPTSEDYDRIARRLVREAMRRTKGRLRADPKNVRRGYVAPCSV